MIASSYTIQKFNEECTILSGLRHPNVVQFLGVYYKQNSPIPMLVTEFMPMTLTECIEKNDTIPPEVSYSILHDVALGLCYLHGNQVIHRDLSANNVLLTADLRAKISDLGVARMIDFTQGSKQLTRAPGTLSYMPPESLIANPTYNTAIDIFSFGVLMLHVFSREWPLPSEPNKTDPENPGKLVALNEAERRSTYFDNMGHTHPLKDLIKNCLENDPERRPDATTIRTQIKDKQSFIPQNTPDKMKWVQWTEQLKEDNEKLITENAFLRTRLEHHNLLDPVTMEDPDGGLHFKLETQLSRFRTESVSSTISTQSHNPDTDMGKVS